MPEPEHRCGQCSHWKKLPPNPQDLRQVLGLCTESPPTPIVALTPQGPVVVGAQYPVLPPDHLTCSRLALRVIVPKPEPPGVTQFTRDGVVVENGR